MKSLLIRQNNWSHKKIDLIFELRSDPEKIYGTITISFDEIRLTFFLGVRATILDRRQGREEESKGQREARV